VKKDEIARRVQDAAKLLELENFLARKPKALSGGQRQRVAMGRAIVREPQVFLMDEPLSNLDAKLRVSTRTQIASLQRRLGITTVYVTHDQIEAMTMGDRVCVLNDGMLQQVDTPLSLYDKPANVFVAGFIGSPAMNIATFKVSDGKANLGNAHLPLARATVDAVTAEGSDQVVLGFRPESLEPAPQEAGGAIPVIVDVVEELGSDAYLYGEAVGPAATDPDAALANRTIIARVEPRHEPQKGEKVYLRIKQGGEHCFSVKTGERLPS
jgi:multiple sugar transport system ATP-binding protein